MDQGAKTGLENAVTAAEVFISYSHRDEHLRDELAKHLKLFERQRIIHTWYDRNIEAGDEWAGDIDENLARADIVLLLISPDFLASDYCYCLEMEHALERHAKGEAVVIPVILRRVDWSTCPFARLQALPVGGAPVSTFHDPDEAFEQIAHGIRAAAERVRHRKSPASPQAGPEVCPFDARELSRVTNALAGLVGPEAAHLVSSAAAHASTHDELIGSLAFQLDEGDRSRFLAALEHPGPAHAAHAAPAWNASDIKRVKELLARYVGPIACVLVDRTAAKVHTASQLYQALAAEIPSESNRQAFLRSLES